MMKTWPLIFAVVFLTVAVVPGPTFGGVIGNTDKAVRTITEPLLDNILDGIMTKDYAKYSRDFEDTMKEVVTQEAFLKSNRQIQNRIGSYKSRTYLGFLKKGNMTLVLWKGKFDKTEDDVLIKLVVSKRKGRYLVTGLWFQ